MKMLSSEVKNLLDKLYNLRGEDSVILAKMNKERQDAIETQERTKNEKTVLLDKIANLTKEENTLVKEGKELTTALSNIKKDDFATVLDRLKIEFDPEDIKTKVDTMLPDTIAKVVAEHQKANEKLAAVETEMNNAKTKVEELGIRKDEALSNQAKLNEYFGMALDGNINITRDAITSLLEKFNFSEDEQREAAKLLMFPEDALYEYDASTKSTKTVEKEIAPVVETAKVVEEKKEEVVVEKANTEEIKEVEKSIQEEPLLTDIFEQVIGEHTEAIESSNELTKANVANELKELGLNLSDSDIDKLFAGYDKVLVSENIKSLKNNNIDLDIIKDNVELLMDKELSAKLEKLINVGKEGKDISLMPHVLVKYNLEGLNNTIDALKTSGLDPKKVPLMAY